MTRGDAKQRQQPAHSLNLWTTYRQARFWIDQERSDIPLPLVPGKFDFAMKWWGHRGTRSARSNGDFPECGSAEQALSDLLRLIESPAPPGGGGEPNGTASDKQSEAVFGQVGLADVTKRVASLEQGAKERAKKLTKTEKIRNQRIKFCCPQRRKKSPDTWNEIYNAYVEKYPDDKTASPDTLLHSHERNCPKCLKDKS